MSVDDPHNLDEQLRSQKDRLDELHDDDSRLLWHFATVATKDKATSTIIQYLSKLRAISEASDQPIEQMTPLEIDRTIDDLEDERGWESSGTRRNYEKAVRVLFKELRKSSQSFQADYDELLPKPDTIRLTDSEPVKITPDDILTKEEIEQLIQDACRTARDRAIVAMLADTGMRVAALLSLRVDDVEFRREGGGIYQPNTEATGLKGDDSHKPLTWSAAHVENYISNEHPRPKDNNAPLFHKSEGWSEDDGAMTPALVRQRLTRLVRSAEVGLDPEDVHPHTFRHTAVTIWARQGFTDREIKHRAGWSRESDMLDRYEHIKEEEINKQILKRYGFDVDDDEIGEPELNRCPRCNNPLHGGENYCPRCSAQLGTSETGVEASLSNFTHNDYIDLPGWADGWDEVDRMLKNGAATEEQIVEFIRQIPNGRLNNDLSDWSLYRLEEEYNVDVIRDEY